MLWNKDRWKSSLWLLLGQKPSPRQAGKTGHADADPLEAIRAAMLAQLGQAGADDYAHVARRLAQAKDIEALWFLRADLMYALSDTRGESEARQRMGRITPLFDGLLLPGLNSRPSPLGERAESG